MPYLFLIFSLLLGLVVGSFLNVAALRYNSGRTLGGRSRCFSCSMQLRWFDLVPVASFLALRGRCRGCGSRLNIQYPIVELITCLVFLAVAWTSLKHGVGGMSYGFFGELLNPYSILHASYFWLIFSLLIVVSIYDLRHKIIPNGLVYAFAALALGRLIYYILSCATLCSTLGVAQQLLAGPILALPLAALWFFSGGRAMGFGDAKLALGIGWLAAPTTGFTAASGGWLEVLSPGISAAVLSFWLGAIYGVSLIVHRRVLSRFAGRVTMKSEIPFGPFLVAGVFIVFVTGLDLLKYFTALL
jgi:leader peptidase (prepilin peptidase)/N-methyltransferase